MEILKFRMFESGKPGKRKIKPLYVNRDQVQAVLPRGTYVTLLVGGKYFHLDDSLSHVLSILEESTETTCGVLWDPNEKLTGRVEFFQRCILPDGHAGGHA